MNTHNKFGRKMVFEGCNGSQFYIAPCRCSIDPIKIEGSDLVYQTTGRFTGWNIECTCCGKLVSNSTEIDIIHSKRESEFRLNACHDCANITVYPTLESMLCVSGDPTPIEVGEFIISKCDK